MGDPGKTTRVGILGGSFDPPHLGHLILAQDAYEQLGLDQVLFVPTFLSPHKSSSHLEPSQRADLVETMIEGDERFACSRIEIDAGETCYSYETTQKIANLYPQSELFWLLGSDQLEKLHMWRNVEKMPALCKFVALKRPGYPLKIPGALEAFKILSVDMHEMLISSSEIRERIKENLPVYMFLHPSVKERIEHSKFYSI